MKHSRIPSSSSKNRKTALLDVRVRRNTRRKRHLERIFNILWKFALILTIVIGGWLGTNKLLTKFFYANPDYNIHHIITNSSEVLSSEDAITTTGLRLGMNIFTVDLEHARQKLLFLPQIRNARVERLLPDTIQIHVEPKIPVAWLVSEKNGTDPYTSEDSLLLEQQGTFYKPPHLLSSYFALPVIYGVDLHQLISGDPLGTEDLHQALELLLLASQRKDPAIRFRSLDLSEGYCIKAQGTGNEMIIFSPENFAEQLDHLQELISFCKRTGKQIESVNLFVRRNIPVRFTLASEETAHTQNNKFIP